MQPRLILGAISLCFFMICLSVSNRLLDKMTVEIRRRKTGGQPASYVDFTGKPQPLRIIADYRRLYPQGKLHVFSMIAFIFAGIGMIGVFIAL